MASFIRRSPHVVLAYLEGTPILLHTQSKESWKLDDTAHLVWQGIESKRSSEGIRAMLGHALMLDEIDAERAVGSVLEEFRTHGLILPLLPAER